MTTANGFFKEITSQLAETLSEVLFPKSAGLGGLFKRPEKIFIGPPTSSSGNAMHLWLEEVTSIHQESGTIIDKSGPLEVRVYRHPEKMSFKFRLSVSELNHDLKLEYLEKLSGYFFDNKSITPIIPKDFKLTSGPIIEKMNSSKSELKLLSNYSEKNPLGLNLTFEYIGPYHTGTALRIEKLVEKRQLDINQQPEGLQ